MAFGCQKITRKRSFFIVAIMQKSLKIILMTFTLLINFIHLSCDQTLSQVYICKPQYQSPKLIIYYSLELTFDIDICCLFHFTSRV